MNGTLIRNGQVEADDYLLLREDQALPTSGRVLLSWDRWQQDGSQVQGHPALSVGVQIPNTLDLTTAEASLFECPLIVLSFPSFGDGRAYSQARLLRDRFHYTGELRATGAAVVRDQLLGMSRCGINSFLLREDQQAGDFLAALGEFDLAYQPAADQLPTVPGLRRSGPN
jgi:uncharacterized protein (DUF934 family)